MKKSLIAVGASAVALAAMPVISTFAVDGTVTDVLTVNIAKSCTITRVGASGATGEGIDAAGTYSEGTYTISMLQNQLGQLGTSSFTVTCNDSQGYDVKGTFGTLTNANSNTITYNNGSVAKGDGKWAATITGGASANVASGGTVKTASQATPAAGDTFSVTYTVGTTTNQEFGSYTNASAAVYELTGKTTNVANGAAVTGS